MRRNSEREALTDELVGVVGFVMYACVCFLRLGEFPVIASGTLKSKQVCSVCLVRDRLDCVLATCS